MAGYTIEVTVSAGDLTFTMPALNVGTYNATIFWGDTTQSTITAYDDGDLAHTYAGAGTYEVEITGSFPAPCFQNTGDILKVTDILDWGDAVDYDGFANMNGLFNGCANIASLPATGSIQSAGVTDTTFAFLNCSSMTGTISVAMMQNLTSIVGFAYMFRNTAITAIESGAFDGFTSVASCDNAFMFMNSLGAIPAGLLQDVAPTCNNYNRAFRDSGMDCVADVLYNDGEQSTVFLNRSPNFTQAFQGAGGGLLPDLWRCNYGTGTPTTTSCFTNATACLNYKNVPVAWGGAAVSAPTITDVDTDEIITPGQTGVVVTGTDLLPYQYDGKIELANNATYGSATVIVEQTVTSWSDTAAQITVVQGGLSAGTVYAFVTTDRGDQNATGFAVTLQSSGNAMEPIAGVLPVHVGAAAFEQVNAATVAGVLPVHVGVASFEQANAATVAGVLPVHVGAAAFEQINAATVAGVFPVHVGAASFANESTNVMGAAASVLPVHVGAASFAQAAAMTAAGVLPVHVGAAAFEQVNAATVAGVLPVHVGAASFTNIAQNPMTVAGVLPVHVGAASFAQVASMTVAGVFPVHVAASAFENLSSVVTNSILRFFPMDVATLQSFEPSENVDGEWTAGAMTTRPIRVRPLQPAVGKELMWLPEGDRAKAHMYTWTTDRVVIHDYESRADPDRLVKNGLVYLVVAAGHWERDDHLELLVRYLPGVSP